MIKLLTKESDYLKTFSITPALFLSVSLITGSISGCSTTPIAHDFSPPENLAPCSSSPNCVSSTDERNDFFIKPMPLNANQIDPNQQTIDEIIDVMTNKMGLEVTYNDSKYVRAEAVSKWFRFVDDVEVMINDDKPEILLRSSSRVGYSDFGVNRARMEEFTRLLNLENSPNQNK